MVLAWMVSMISFLRLVKVVSPASRRCQILEVLYRTHAGVETDKTLGFLWFGSGRKMR